MFEILQAKLLPILCERDAITKKIARHFKRKPVGFKLILVGCGRAAFSESLAPVSIAGV
jgi:hypothetical protein